MPNPPHHRRLNVAARVLSATLAAWVAEARADAPLSVTIEEPVPFSREELAASIAARMPTAPPGTATQPVIIGPASPAGIAVRTGKRTHLVPVGDRRGSSAARVVALVVTDLMVQELAPAQDMALTSRGPAPEPGAWLGPLALRLTVVGGVSKGSGAEEPYGFALDADATLPLRQVVVGLMLGGAWIPQRRAGRPDEVAFTEAVGRLVIGWRRDPFEILAGPFVSPYALTGAAEHAGVLLGAGVIGRLAPHLTGHLRLVVSLRADGYTNRTHVSWTTGGGFATPRCNTTIGAGLAWDFGT